jgi:hypothetical protein
MGEQRTYERALAASHAYPEDGVFPIKCPFCGDITKEMWEEESNKYKCKSEASQLAFRRKFALDHRGQMYLRDPLMRHVDHKDQPGCVLHVLLCIVGQFYKRAIAQNVETMDQVTDINEYLRKDLHVYIRPPKVIKKGEEQTLLKRPSFIGEEAGKVIENLEALIIRLNQGKEISAVQKLEIKAADEFMLMYNLVSVRVENAQDPAQRRTKALKVGRQASRFIRAYTKAFGNGAACTVYIHTLCCTPPCTAYQQYSMRHHGAEWAGTGALQPAPQAAWPAHLQEPDPLDPCEKGWQEESRYDG